MRRSWLQTLLASDLNAAANWSVPLKALVFVVIAAFGGVAGGVLWVMPAQQQLTLTAQSEAALKARYQAHLVTVQDVAQLQQRRASLAAHRDAVVQALPGSISAADFVQSVTRIGTANNLAFGSFALGEPEPGPLVSALPFSLLLQGSYQDFIGFLNSLTNLEQPVTLHDFDMRQNAETQQLLELKLDAKALYRSASERSADAGSN